MTRVGLAEAYARLGLYSDSNDLFIKALAIVEAKCGSRSLRTADVFNKYAKVLRYQNRKTEATQFEERARQIRDEATRPQPGAVIDVQDLTSFRDQK